MPPSPLSSLGLGDLVRAALSLPLFSLLLAVLVFAIVLMVNRRQESIDRSAAAPHVVTVRYRHEHRILGIGSLVVIAVFSIENVVRGYLVMTPDVVSWWRFATPVFAVFAVLAVALGSILVRRSALPTQPVMPLGRRTWRTFNSTSDIALALSSVAALLVTTILAGLASSADSRGRFIHLQIPVPNSTVDPLRPWFYGWAYGVPVLIGLAGLAVVTALTLHASAARSFLRPDTVGPEQGERMKTASGVARLAAAASLLALGGALRFIARAGSLSGVSIEDGNGQSNTYEMIWKYAEFAVVGGWLAPVLEVVAFLLLLLVANRLLRRTPAARTIGPRDTAQPAGAAR
ncbi:hypothetical protein [Mycetocola zhadangensis]|uniref:Uncharacterized protein n=1 Tax=Mycetocola zhadangensis TaxID=1164595 RepID=A0A3L7J254_9MICO|nr:hypothetical protein [Mycetocola zhadangensis]RLQ84534.1 hypothetical protein D9V28_10210 [Mycetocola zhadangensis]GGE92111.1 hypothetical protein GCM10011313_13780 [Mycetocola zhadangensis]